IARDIVPLRAKLEAGDVRTNANMMDSVSLDGVHLYNDAQMDPSANSYVPVIRGVANSNAKVTVRQEGRIVTQITVPPGPFAISDYYAAQNGSDLDVTGEAEVKGVAGNILSTNGLGVDAGAATIVDVTDNDLDTLSAIKDALEENTVKIRMIYNGETNEADYIYVVSCESK
ncbi:MAG: fimbria/pilus outer membrane usher protein, partial [Veillonella sp.]|nr:fimbria/pilus outer membrane usher protein [Veillonella sp.]